MFFTHNETLHKFCLNKYCLNVTFTTNFLFLKSNSKDTFVIRLVTRTHRSEPAGYRAGFILNTKLHVKRRNDSMWECASGHIFTSNNIPHPVVSNFLLMRPMISSVIEKIGKGNPVFGDCCGSLSVLPDQRIMWGREQASADTTFVWSQKVV